MTSELLVSMAGVALNLVVFIGGYVSLRVSIEHRLTRIETTLQHMRGDASRSPSDR